MSSIPEQIDQIQPKPSRRTVLGVLVAVINIAVVGAVLTPVANFVISPLRRKRGIKWTPILAEAELADGETREVDYVLKVVDGYQTVDRKYSLFLRRTGSDVVAIDPSCTHLGCRVGWQGDKSRFVCPCHGGVFDADGNVVSGPPPKPLVRHNVKVEKGQIWVAKEV